MLRKYFKGIRGVAIEWAIVFGLVVLATGTMLISSMMLSHRTSEFSENRLRQKTDLNQIGEFFLRAVETGNGFPDSETILNNPNFNDNSPYLWIDDETKAVLKRCCEEYGYTFKAEVVEDIGGLITLYTDWGSTAKLSVLDNEGNSALYIVIREDINYDEERALYGLLVKRTSPSTTFSIVEWTTNDVVTIEDDDDDGTLFGAIKNWLKGVVTTVAERLGLRDNPKEPIQIYFEKNGGNCNTPYALYEKPTTSGEGVSVTLPEATREGFRFDGWYTKQGSEGDETSWGTKVGVAGQIITEIDGKKITDSMKLYAQWSQYQGTLIYNDGSGKTLAIAGSVVLPALPRTNNQKFGGWYHEDGTEPVGENGATYYLQSKDEKLYGRWFNTEDVAEISFKLQPDGAVAKNYIYTSEQVIDLNRLYKPEMSGHTFIGWYYSDDPEQKLVTDDYYARLGTEVTLIAKWDVATYKLSFYAEDGKTLLGETTYTVNDGTLRIGCDAANALSKDGYETYEWAFVTGDNADKWAVVYDKDYIFNQSSVALTSRQRGNVSFKMNWLAKEYNVTYLEEVGGEVYGNGATYNAQRTSFILADAPEKPGYIFQGWKVVTGGKTNSGTEDYFKLGRTYGVDTKEIPLNVAFGDVTIAATWELAEYSIIFRDGDEVLVSDTYTLETTEFVIPGPRSQDGKMFVGWMVTQGGSGYNENANTYLKYENLYDANTVCHIAMAYGDVVFEPLFVATTYTIKYDMNGGTGPVSPQTVNYPNKVTLAGSKSNPTKSGYVFDSWNTAADGTGTRYEGGQTYDLFRLAKENEDGSYSVTLYARYAKLYTVYLSVREAAGLSVGTTEVSQEYYNKSWSTPTQVAQQFRAGEKVTFNASFNNGGYEMHVTYKNDTSKYLIVTDAVGNAQTGQYARPFAAGYYSFTMPAADVLIKADGNTLTESFDSYQLSYENCEGAYFSAALKTIVSNSEEFYVPNPTKTGYIFKGWRVSNMGTRICTKYYKNDSDTSWTTTKDETISNTYATRYKHLKMTAGTITFYANWEPISYNLEFNLDGGKLYNEDGSDFGTLPNKATYDVEFNIPNPKKTGYTFVGWQMTIDGIKQTIPYSGTTMKNLVKTDGSTVAFKALWTPTVYSLYFYSNGGSGSQMKMQEFQYAEYKRINKCTYYKTGYVFAGWATEKNGAVVYVDEAYVEKLTDVLNQVIYLYAIWEPVQYKVSFQYHTDLIEDKEETWTYSPDFVAKTVKNPERVGYRFTGWTISGMDGYEHKIGGVSKYATYLENVMAESFANLRISAGKVIFQANWVPEVYQIELYSRFGVTGNIFKTIYVRYDDGFYANYDASTGICSTKITSIGWNVSKLGYTMEGFFVGCDSNNNGKTDTTKLCGSNGTITAANNTFVADTRVYAAWRASRCYLNIDGTTGTTPYDYDSNITVNAPTKTGYSFTGWNVSGMDGNTHYYSNTFVDPTKMTTTTEKSLSKVIAKNFRNLSATDGARVTFTSTWNPVSYSISFDVNGGDSEVVTRYYNIETTSVNLPTPTRTGYEFKGWLVTGAAAGGPAFGTGTTYQFSDVNNMAGTYGNVTLKAQWEIKKFTLSFAVADANTGTVSTATVANVPYGTELTVSGNKVTVNGTTVTATAKTGYKFLSWMHSNATLTNMQVKSDLNITAKFDIQRFDVTVKAGANGTVDDTAGKAATERVIRGVPYNTVLTNSGNTVTVNGTIVTATPNTGYKFGSWTNGTATVTADTTVTANFSVKKFTINFTVADADTGTVSTTKVENVPYGAALTVSGNQITVNNTTVTATAATGYDFLSWMHSNATLTNMQVKSDLNITAKFDIQRFDVTVKAGANGTVDDTAGKAASEQVIRGVPYNTVITNSGNTVTVNGTIVTATPNTGYKFGSWTNGTATVTADTTVTANFSIKTFTVNIAVADANTGTVSTTKVENVPYGAALTVSDNTVTVNNTTVTATAATGYDFLSWMHSNATLTDMEVKSDLNITAKFDIQRFTVIVKAGANGTGSKTFDGVAYNTPISATVTSNTNNSVQSTTVKVDEQSVTLTASKSYYRFSSLIGMPAGGKVTGDLEITANFVADTYTVTVNVEHGYFGTGTDKQTSYTIQDVPYYASISTDGATLTVTSYYGNVVATVTATPDTGYDKVTWQNTSEKISADRTVTGTFAEKLCKVEIVAGTNGTGSKTLTDVPYGTAISATVTSNSDNSVQSTTIKVGEQEITLTASEDYYRFSSLTGMPAGGKVTGDLKVTANFSADTYTVTVKVNNGYYGTADNKQTTYTVNDVPYYTSLSVNGNTLSFTRYKATEPYKTITLTPEEGYEGCSWSTNATGTVKANRTVTATFTLKQFKVTVNAGDNGSVDVDTDKLNSVNYNTKIIADGNTLKINKTVVATATPADGYKFDSWSANGVTITDATTITDVATITANFVPNTVNVTITVKNGTAPNGTAEQTLAVPYGTTIKVDKVTNSDNSVTTCTITVGKKTYTVTADEGYHFAGITGVSTEATAVTEDVTIEASCGINAYTVTINVTDGTAPNGTTQQVFPVNHGTKIKADITSNSSNDTTTCKITIGTDSYTVTAAKHYHFSSLTGVTTTEAKVTGDITIDVTCAINTYTVTVNAGSNGRVDKSSVASVPYGSKITVNGNILTVKKPNGDPFATVTATGSSTSYGLGTWTCNSKTITDELEVTGALTVNANFVQVYKLTISSSDANKGSVSRTELYVPQNAKIYPSGNNLIVKRSDGTYFATITATGTGDYGVGSWSCKYSNQWNILTSNGYKIEKDRSVRANFTKAYTVTVNAGEHGSVNITSITNVPEGAEITTKNNTLTINGTTVTATADEGYEFTSWSNASGNVTNARTITANFTMKKFKVSVAAGTNGKVNKDAITDVPYGSLISVSDNKLTVKSADGKTVLGEITATPNDHYHLGTWSGVPASGKVTAAVNASVSFAIDTYTVTVAAGENGKVDKTSVTDVPYGATFTLSDNTITINGTKVTATPDNGYALKSWTNGAATVTGDMTVTANFAAVRTVSFTVNDGNYGSVSTTSITVADGATLTISGNTITVNGTTVTATNKTGYHFDKWTQGTGTTAKTGTITVDGNITLKANFAVNTYTVTISVNNASYGSVNQTSITNVTHGSTLTINSNKITVNGTEVTATAQTGYHFDKWTQGSTTKTGSITVNGDITLTANFAANTYKVKFDANGGSGSMNDQSFTYGVSQKLTQNTFKRSSYTFKGWSTKQNAQSATYTDKQSVSNLTAENGATVTLYAVWQKNGGGPGKP